MAWIESHQDLGRHPKTKRLARALGVSLVTAVGHLHFLWWWALDYADDGELGGYDASEIAEAAMWEGDPDQFLTAMVSVGFLDTDGQRITVHDWWDYAGRLVQRREDNARRMREKRAQHVQGTCATRAQHVRNTCATRAPATVPNPTQPNQTVPISSSQPATNEETEIPDADLTPTASEDAIRLCEVLRGLIVSNDPKSPAGKLSAKQSANWITDMDRLIRLDGRDPTEVERVIRWCQADSFWKTNILSAAKLRKQYSQLLLKMREARPPGNNGHKRAPVPVAAKPETPMERSMRLYGIWPPPVDAEDSDTGPPDNHKPHYEKPPVPNARASPEERELYDRRLELWRNKQPWYDT